MVVVFTHVVVVVVIVVVRDESPYVSLGSGGLVGGQGTHTL